jgi:YidC/Oxa1 family membrane protein insertase
MNFDRNTILGFLLLGVLLLGFFWTTSREQAAYRKKQLIEQAKQDSIAKANMPSLDSVALKEDSAKTESVAKVQKAGVFYDAADTTEQLTFAENDFLKIAFTNKGGQPKWVELKKFKNPDSSLVKLAASDFDHISYLVKAGPNKSAQVADLYFSPADKSVQENGETAITFKRHSSDSSVTIIHRFIIRPGDYMIDFNVELLGADKLLTQGIMNFSWQYSAAQLESDITFEKQNSQIGYVMDDEYDYHTVIRRSSKEFNKPVKWIGVRQRFFNTILVAKNNFSSGNMEWTVPPDAEKKIVDATASMRIELPAAASAAVSFSIFYGPADYSTLRSYDMKFDKLINLGQGPYAFVRPVNRFLVMPIFEFFKGMVSSYGLAIVLLTIVIRLLISPLTYSSYLSGAKMKVLRPEIAVLREKYGKDQQQMSMEQMKMFREAGVNPLGGCIPALLQIPIFFALYSFFNSNVDLRGKGFLWADDLSAYDAFINFGFNIPLLGSHLSLFTIFAVITSFLISVYSMSLTPDQSNPVLKYMPYIFPVFLLFIFNRLPSALTWYYSVSNIITLGLQFVIINYIIDHKKILAKIEENRKKPKKKSKWQEKFEQMQEQQKKMKDMQQKGKR